MDMEMDRMVTITMEEYKELLETKGRYEELKTIYLNTIPQPYKPTITWTSANEGLGISKEPYRVTCEND